MTYATTTYANFLLFISILVLGFVILQNPLHLDPYNYFWGPLSRLWNPLSLSYLWGPPSYFLGVSSCLWRPSSCLWRPSSWFWSPPSYLKYASSSSPILCLKPSHSQLLLTTLYWSSHWRCPIITKPTEWGIGNRWPCSAFASVRTEFCVLVLCV